jgi:hypothetical protein
MHPNFALHRLVDCVRPDMDEIQLARDRFAGMRRKLAQAFPRARFVPIGSHSRGTAIAVHSHVDFLAVLQTEWARWGGRRVAPMTIIDRITDNVGYLQLALAPRIRRDERGVELHFHGTTFSVDVIPGFILRLSNQYPVYSLPGEDSQWIEASPERHNALFSIGNATCGAKLRALSQLIKVWRFAHSPPLRISGLYVDMLLAASDIGMGVKSYGQCMSDFFSELGRQEPRSLADPAGVSGVIVASPTNDDLERVHDAAKIAANHAQSALAAQASGSFSDANREWEAIFKRRLAPRRLVH